MLERKEEVRRPWLALCLIGVMAVQLVERLAGGLDVLRLTSWVLMFGVVLLGRRALGLREAYLMGAGLLLSVFLLLARPHPGQEIAAGLDQGAFLMAFILLLGLLHEAAGTSPSVSSAGAYMTRQPPRRRYFALSAGSGAMAVLFNMGVISFLVPLIQRGINATSPGDPLNPIRERRQVSAMLRGFAWSVLWSPTAIAPLALIELLPEADRAMWTLHGLIVYLIVMLLGALEDAWRFRRFKPRKGRPMPPFPWRDVLMFLAACSWLLVLTGGFVWITGDSLVGGLMLACPLMLLGWLGAQNLHRGGAGWRGIGQRLSQIAWVEMPATAPLAVTLAASGFLGRAGAGLLPPDRVADLLGLQTMPDALLLSLLPLLLVLLSLLALSPIILAIFFGSLFGGMAQMPADPTLLALAISAGWALSMTFSPFSTVVLLIDRVGHLAPLRVTWGWNLLFTLLALGALAAYFTVLTGGG